MMSETIFPLLATMVATSVLAGTYGGSHFNGERTQTEEIVHQPSEYSDELGEPQVTEEPNYPIHRNVEQAVEKPPQKVNQVYTRTIVRPVSYAYISANVPLIQRTTQETALYHSEKTEDIDPAEESQQHISIGGHDNLIQHKAPLFLGRKTVLLGKLLDLQHRDYASAGPALQPHPTIGGPTDGSHSVVHNPLGGYQSGTSAGPVIHTQLKNHDSTAALIPPGQEYTTIRHHITASPNAYSTLKKELFHVSQGGGWRHPPRSYRGFPPLENPPLPETILKPPSLPIEVLNQHTKPDFYPGEYRNQFSSEVPQDTRLNTTLDVDEKSSSFLGRLKSVQEIEKHPVPTPPLLHYIDYIPNKPNVPTFPEEPIKSETQDTDTNDQSESASGHEGESDGDHNKSIGEHKKLAGAGHKKVSGGSEHEEHHASKKGAKGEKGYKKNNKHEKAEKGHHDKEAHKGEYLDEKGEEKKFHKGEGFYGEHHKEKKGEKAKKFGEGKNHKKGHTTHGEHNIVKKNEYIKSTKFYDEDHGGGEEEAHGEFHGHHTEKEGGKKVEGHKKKGYHKDEKVKKGHHDKGHHDEEHAGHDHDEGSEDFYGYEEEYGGEKGGKSVKKWGKE